MESKLTLRLERSTQEEGERIAAALDGDPGARAWIAEIWFDPIYRFSFRMLGNEEDARDAAQESLLKVLQGLPRYDPSRRFSTWVFGITRNTCIDEHRRRRRRAPLEDRDIPDDRPSGLDITERERRARDVQTALQKIGPMYREAILLYHFEHLKYREIAEALNLPIGTVMNRIFRARQLLRNHLDLPDQEELACQAT
jgi:RNA polymerase sigma-70 factor (ECF subfamily)